MKFIRNLFRNKDRDCVLLLLQIIRFIYRDLKHQKIALNNKVYEEVKNINQEIIDNIEDLELEK